MLRSVLTTAIRHFARHQVYSTISLGGLVIGITAAMLLFIWVIDELDYDRYHPDNDRVFMVLREKKLPDGQLITGETTPAPLADYLKSEIPEIESICRVGFGQRVLVANGNKSINADGTFAESSYFDVFNIPVLIGNRTNLLPDNNSIVISEKLAKTLFDDSAILGKTILVNNQMEFRITGVFADHPTNSSLSSEYVLPFEYHAQQELSTWDDSNVYTYVKLNNTFAKQLVEEKIKDKIDLVRGTKETTLFLFGFTDWHLYYNEVVNRQPGGGIVYVIAFSLTGFFILVMACINFINLSTARAAIRAREIGVRKMSGATRSVLIRQFMMESLLITTLAVIFSLLLVYLSLPLFNAITGKELTLSVTDSKTIFGTLAILLFTGVLAGGYPAFLLSSLKPATILKGNVNSVFTGAHLRRGLVVFQFSLSVILIFCAIIIQQQVEFLKNKNLGFDKDNVMYFEPGQETALSVEVFKAEAFQNPNIEHVGQAAASPMEINGVGEVFWKVNGSTQTMLINNNPCDYDYLPTLGFELIKGRNFSPTIISDSAAVVITETAAELMGFEDPIGQIIDFGFEAKIIGVVKDFHNADIHTAIAPVVFYLGNEETFGRWKRIFIRYKPGTQTEVMEYLKSITQKLTPGMPYEFRFVDQDFEYQFAEDLRVGALSVFFTIIAIVVACLGLFGLTLFNTQRRTKEIGVRKVLGATIAEVVVMLCKDFSRPIIIALILALPVAYFIMTDFLTMYQYHTQITYSTFIITGLVLLILALLTVAYQSIQAAKKNPVEALKTE
ncbi:MAG TPA: ABC transporter permease [Cyclobacteriaceae bacterium]|nr:ABC transporter permease [Cyclobacteriaceae bacterium]